MLKYALFYPAQLLVLLTVLALVWRTRGSSRVLAWVAGAGLIAFLAVIALEFPRGGDLAIFWQAGADWWSGADPYRRPPFLNPPTALPVYAGLAMIRLETLVPLWVALSAAGYLLLTPAADKVLRDQGDPGSGGRTPAVIAVLGVSVALSFACRYGLDLCQFALPTTLLLLAAVAAQDRGRPVLAGCCLGLASIKAATVLPFLLLFQRGKDLRTWVSLAGTCVVLSLLASNWAELPGRYVGCLANIHAAGAAGEINDYSVSGPMREDIVSLDSWIYHLGVRDRSEVRLAQSLILGALTVGVGWMVRGGRVPRGAAVSLVCCLASLFLYHRLYDMVILVVPLTYALGNARTTDGRARWLYAGCATACLGVLYLRLDVLKPLAGLTNETGVAARLAEAIVLPYGAWLVLLTMFGLVAAEYARRQTSDEGAVLLRHPSSLAAAR